MGLSYHYSLHAPARTTAAELASFLERVEGDAKLMGFGPTIVVNGPFDTPERREFSRRVARGLMIEDPRLKGVEVAREGCWGHYPDSGECRLAPTYGVLLVVTDQRGAEIVFGFFRHPETIRDRSGRELMAVPEGREWRSGECVDSPDPRYRAIVRRFREAGYLESELDEFVPAEKR